MLEQSVKILEEALNASALKGVFSLKDSAVVFQALSNVVNALDLGPKEEVKPVKKATK